MIRRIVTLAALLTGSLAAQGIYQNAASPSDPVCPRIERDKIDLHFGSAWSGTTGGQMGADSSVTLQYQVGSRAFPQGERKTVTSFAAYDAKGHGTSIANLKGKVVLVGLWSTRCDPSAKMLMEFSAIYSKHEAFGFEILAVNFDENQQDGGQIEGGWRAINRFVTKNRSFFETSKLPVFTPGLGKEGASNFMDIVHSLPVLIVIDREGNMAQLHVGYKDGFVGNALKQTLLERPLPAAPAPPSPTAPPAP